MVDSEAWRGKVGGMSEAEANEFLSGNTICRLGCLDGDGWPYVIPIWYEYSDSLCIDEAEGLRKVMAKGTAEILEEPNVGGDWVKIATRMSVRYLGVNGPSYLAPTLPEPRWLIFVRPENLTTWQGVDWAKKYKTTNWG